MIQNTSELGADLILEWLLIGAHIQTLIKLIKFQINKREVIRLVLNTLPSLNTH